MVRDLNDSVVQQQAIQFKVALLLKQYKFGAAAAAKYLGKTRGLVQSWMQIGNRHHLAKQNIQLKKFETLVKTLRRRITKENLDYFLVMRLIDFGLPVTFISKVLELPTSTVRSWWFGKVPPEIKQLFYDSKLVDREFKKLLRFLKLMTTRNNLEYFLALRLAETKNDENGTRRLGGRVISKLLRDHFGYIKPIPDKTISCWIEGKRKPWSAFQVLADKTIIDREYHKIIDEQTRQYLDYHIAKTLAVEHDWNYSKISQALKINKEVVRGWIKKGRGHPVAKALINNSIVDREVGKYFAQGAELNSNEPGNARAVKPTILARTLDNFKDQENRINPVAGAHLHPEDVVDQYNELLEKELIYHLETIPTGVSSPKVLKSILIDHQNASVEEITRVLQASKHIVQNGGKWMLKRLVDEQVGPDEEDDQ